MGRGKHCSEETRRLIKKLISEGKTYKDVQNLLSCSAKMIRNALIYEEKVESRGRKSVMSQTTKRMIKNVSTRNPLVPATEIRDSVCPSVSVETVRRVLRENNLYARSPRKVPLLKKIHVTNRLRFAKTHIIWPAEKWRNILWSDESKIVLYGGTGSRQYVRRPQNKEYDPRYTTKTIKHGGSNVMVWACFSYYGVGPIHWIRNIMDATQYVEILQNIMLPYAEYEMPLKWTFQQDNDPKHTSRLAKRWFQDNNIDLMEWPAQSPDLNPIENLWCDIKKEVAIAKPKKNNELWSVIQEAWQKIPRERCKNLVDSMKRRCEAVLRNKGCATKY